MSTRLLSIASILLTAALLLAACSSPGDDRGRSAQPLGGAANAESPDGETMRAAFDLVRHQIFEAPSSDPAPLEGMPGSRVFLCAYYPDSGADCASAAGSDLADSLLRAVSSLTLLAGRKLDPERRADVRLKIDVAMSVEPAILRAPKGVIPPREVGLFGLWVERAGEIGWILPGEILERGLYDDDDDAPGLLVGRVQRLLLERNPALAPLPDPLEYLRLQTASWVERALPAERPEIFPVQRVHAFDRQKVERSLLLQRAVWAADYLTSSMQEDGRIAYRYDVVGDRDRSGYNLLRHAGTTYSILQVYARTQHAPYLRAARAAIGYLLRNSGRDVRNGPYGGGEVMYVAEPGRDHLKLGGAGLALLMLTEYAEITGELRDEAGLFGRFLVSQQQQSGEFIYFPPLLPAGEPNPRVNPYYPGEAILGLMRLYALDPQPVWLESAIRGADWLIDVRDRGKSAATLENDHWLMIALSYLFKETRDPRYLDHSLQIAQAVRFAYGINLQISTRYPDYRGGYGDPPGSTPAATRAEGLIAVLDSCELAELDCSWVEQLLIETVSHELQSQYTPDLVWWVPNRARTLGGWAGGLISTEIRNDYVQHNLSAMLGTERRLAARAGETLPGGPGWSGARASRPSFDAPSLQQMQRLRSESVRYRGKIRWDEP